MVLLQNGLSVYSKEPYPGEGRRGPEMASPERSMENHNNVKEHEYLFFSFIFKNSPVIRPTTNKDFKWLTKMHLI